MHKLLSTFKSVFDFTKLVLRHDKMIIIVLVFEIITQSIPKFIPIIILKLVVSSLFEGNYYNPIPILTVLSIVNIIIASLNQPCRWARVKKEMQIKEYLNILISDKILSSPLEQIESSSYQNSIELTRKSIGNSTKIIFENYISVLSALIQFIGMAGLLISVDLSIAIITVVCVSFIYIYEKKKNIIIQEIDKENTANERTSRNFFDIISNYKNGKDIRIFSANEFLIGKYKEYSDNYIINMENISKISFKVSLIKSITIAQNLFVYLFLIYLFITHKISASNFSMTIATSTQCMAGLNNLFSSINGIKYNISFVNILLSNINFSLEKIQELKTDFMFKVTSNNCIEFVDVYFKYPGGSEYALKNINLKIQGNENLAIVGLNGSGKTTLIKLLLRFYAPTKGKILFNGEDIQKLDILEYISLFSATFQDFKMFAYTIRENLIFDNTVESNNISKMINSAKYLGVDEFIDKLPNKYEEFYSKLFDESGIDLSGGQQQKIALARMHIKESIIYILDEPTYALDPISEYDLYNKLKEITHKKATIFISHRMSSAKLCDRILVVNDGEIAENGNFSELINADGLFSLLYNTQAKYYDKINDEKVEY